MTPRLAAVPFHLRRKEDSVTATTVTSTTEVIHGLLRLEGDRLVVQWRTARHTDRVGAMSVRSDEEVGAVHELVVPLSGVAGASVRRRWWLPVNPQLVLRAADLRAFEALAGEGGLRLHHPAELILGLRRSDLLTAEEFTAELALAVVERALAADDEPEALPRSPSPPESTMLGQGERP